jgi:collagenase-like PrtC family protease
VSTLAGLSWFETLPSVRFAADPAQGWRAGASIAEPHRPATGHQLELLSPARDADIGIEAINHGADAVYIGGPGLGPRIGGQQRAGHRAAVRHAHKFHSRIFVTHNTILRDDELEPARQMAWDVYHAGADVLIIQDMGLLEMDLPPIQLHASTQTDIRTPEKARFLQDVGFSQMVLARELTLAQIRAIHDVLDPDRCKVEFFIHGALCVAYSGQCYISHAHTGRSANRGDCSQACRLPYEVVDSQGRIVAHEKHVLSMKDNNQSANLARADRRRCAQLQDRGPLQGHGLCEEHHGPLPPTVRRPDRRP